MDEILVSVVIPAYNCAHRIHLALDSALAQDVPLEIIVVNDCSSDNLAEAIAKYLRFPQVRYLENPENLGVAATRNRGVASARGAYTAFLDADDYWEPNKLKRQLALIAEQGTVMCSTARELMTPDGSLTGHIIPVQTEYTYRDLLRHNPINCSSVLIKTEVAREFPMHHDDAHEDYLMWMEVLEKYGRGCAINEPLLKYRLTNTGESGSKLNSARMTFMTYRYKGFGFFRSVLYFSSYAFHGLRKYLSCFLK